MSILARIMIVLLSMSICTGDSWATGWPVFPDSTVHRLGNSYGQYQHYDGVGVPFMHTGIDIMVPPGSEVYAVKSGYVKAILTSYEEAHWRVAVADSSGWQWCDGFMYAHVDSASMVEEAGLEVGQYIGEGQFLGRVVHFPYTDTNVTFDHLHFSKIRSQGFVWNNFSSWIYVRNPLDEIEDLYDPEPPVFENAYGDQKLAFCTNGTASYFGEGEPVSGDVDIICRVYDRFNHPDWKLTPYRLEYRIDGEVSTDWINSVCFTFELGTYNSDAQNAVGVIYQNDSICDSRADYYYRWYFINLTNTDGDSLLEASDTVFAWNTVDFPNGEYRIYMRAHDRAGNTTLDSMNVTVENRFSIYGTISLEGSTDFSGAIVTAAGSETADTTDSDGAFLLADIESGWQEISVSRLGYYPSDSLIHLSSDQQLDMTLSHWFFCGDADGSGGVDIDDVVFLITHIFLSSPPPEPAEAGDADCSGSIDIDDVVYLIAHIFSGGPEPCAECK